MAGTEDELGGTPPDPPAKGIDDAGAALTDREPSATGNGVSAPPGRAPVDGTGEGPVDGTGEAPVDGTGEGPVDGTGGAPVDGTGEAPVDGTGEGPVDQAADDGAPEEDPLLAEEPNRVTGGSPGPEEAPSTRDRDQVDFSAVTGWLRRRNLLGPPRPPRERPSGRQPALVAASEGTDVGGHRAGGAGGATLVDRVLVDRDPATSPALPWQQLDWRPDADRRPIHADRLARVLVVAATVTYIWLFAYWTMRNHDGFGTQAFDFGIYDQGLWLMSRFKRPFITIMGRHLFGDHTSFILLPLVPVYWILPSAKVLLFTQAAALGGAAIPAFLFAREKLRSEWLAALVACAYLLHPSIAFTNLEQFHPDAFEPILIFFALWFMVKHRWGGFLIFCAAALLVKEDVALLIFPLGLYVAFRYDRRIGAITCLMSLAMITAALYWILPMYNGVGSLNSWRVPFGGVGGLVKTFILHPGEVITYATEKPRTWYVWQMFSPVAFMPLLDLRMLAVVVPALAANVLSTFSYQYDIHYHYGTLIVPTLIAGTVFAISRARSMAGRQIMVGIVVASSLVTAYLWGPTPLGRHEAVVASPDGNSIPYLERANDIIPKDAILSAFYGYVPHFDHREEIYMFPNPFKASYWGTFKTEGQRLPFADRVEYILLPTILDSEPKAVLDQIRGDYDLVFEEGNVTLLRRRGVSP